MGKGSGSKFFRRIKNFFFPPVHNQYLLQHGFFDSFDERKYMRSPELFPYLPYSLQDIIESKMLTGLKVFVASHTSTAVWLSRRKNLITLGRKSHYRWRSDRVKTITDYREYGGDKLDMLIWDSHRIPEDWQSFIEANLSPRGVVIIVFYNLHDAMELGFGVLGDVLLERGLKSLEFQNPGPHTEIMTAELYYPQDNVLNI